MTKFRIQSGLIIILALFALSLLLSQKANPDMPPFFALKRIQEKVFLNFKSNPEDKLEYLNHLLSNRLVELSNVVKNKNYDYVLKSSLRYSTLAGQITDLIIVDNMKDKIPVITAQFIDHQAVLYDIYVIYPKNIPDNEEWKYIQDDINYLDLYLQKLSEQ